MKKINKRSFKPKEAMILFRLTFGKNASATFISSQFSSYVTISVAL